MILVASPPGAILHIVLLVKRCAGALWLRRCLLGCGEDALPEYSMRRRVILCHGGPRCLCKGCVFWPCAEAKVTRFAELRSRPKQNSNYMSVWSQTSAFGSGEVTGRGCHLGEV